MGRATSRRFTLGDGMILIAAIGAGYAATRPLFQLPDPIAFLSAMASRPGAGWWSEDGLDRLLLLWFLAQPGLMLGAVGLLIVNLRLPRDRPPDLGRRAGFVACVWVSVMLGVVLAANALHLALVPSHVTARGLWLDSVFYTVLYGPIPTGSAVAVGWATQLIGRSRRTEPSAIDRAGRWLGWWMIGSIPVGVGSWFELWS
jgi:hypothetical protein